MHSVRDAVIAPTFSRRYLHYSVLLLFLVNVVNYMDRSVINVLIEPIRKEFGLSDAHIGLLTGFAFALFYAIAGLFLANLADRVSRRALMSVSITLWSIMTALTGAAQTFWHLFVTRIGVGIGEASTIPASYSLLADYFAPARRALVIGIVSSGTMVGVMVGSMLGGFVAESFGWRWAFVAAAVPGIPLALLVAWSLRDPIRGASDGLAVTESIGLISGLRQLLANRSACFLILSFAFITFLAQGVITWIPAYFMRRFDIPLSAVGTGFGLAIGLGTAVGSVLGGTITSTLARRDIAWLTRFPLWITPLIWLSYELMLLAPSFSLSLVAIAWCSVLSGASFGPVLSAMQTVAPANLRSTTAGLNGFVASFIGIGSAPLLIGLMSDHFQARYSEAVALQNALMIAVCAAFFSLVALYFSHRSFKAAMTIHKEEHR